MSEFVVRELKARASIFKEGTIGEVAYILKEGKVAIYSSAQTGTRYQLAELSAPTIFGEMALLSKEQLRTASAETVTPVRLIEISKEQFDAMMAQSSPIISLTMQAMAVRLVETTQKYLRAAI